MATLHIDYTALDGQVAAYMDDGQYLVTSPNTFVVYKPFLGPREIYFRKDYHFGPDNLLLYPQPFIPLRCHWASIPRRPTVKDNRLHKWWDEPPEWTFIQDTDSAIQGMGLFASTYVEDFAKDYQILHARVFRYSSLLKTEGKAANSLVLALDRQLLQTLRHIKTVSLPLHLARQLWSFFQRWYLELVGALDWVEVYKPVMDGQKSKSDFISIQASAAMGAFAYSIADCEFLFCAGLPFWYVWSAEHRATKRVDSMVDLTTPESIGICLDDLTSHPRQVIYEGPSTDLQKAVSVEKFGMTIVDAGSNPFAVPCAVVIPAPSQPISSQLEVGPSRTSSKRSRQDPYKKSKPKSNPKPQAERDKFAEICGPSSPDIPDVWVEALGAIDKTRRPKKSDVANGGYAFPDPGMVLFAPQEKQHRLLRSWLQFRSILIFRHTMKPCPASSAWSPRQWQLLLAMTDEHPSKAGSYVAQERSVVQDLLGQCLKNYGLTHVKVEPHHITWRNHRHSIDFLSNPKNIKEIIWEVYELNFRFELRALDSKLRGTIDMPSEVDQGDFFRSEVKECFPDATSVGHQSCVDFNTADCGLAARELKDRAVYFLKFCKLLKSWPGGSRAEKILSGRREAGDFSEFELEEMERWATRFYCQTFYENFGRPPVLPHALYTNL
ncbi:hypothetical protein E1B28_002261 [Marasmius oreades]|uniref:Uncharacterized protein n=1 Tax=Marasmius oreades TaxID=181124 RepID=A0A9P7UKE2_9AGAR|nr:uncharacterized protein E1B28_002261 [Marasmius oreades]KAG7086297.1 hypothetical protein E1B28_002261 [Marasmius oreades]